MDSQTQLKIDQEEKFQVELMILFNRIRNEYRVSVATGNPVRADRYEAQFKALIEAHYRRVQKAFRGESGVEINDEDIVLGALMLWVTNTAGESTEHIVSTTQRNLDDSLSRARQALADAGNTRATAREIASVVTALLFRVFIPRSAAIAVLETQRTAESTKLIEAYDAAGLDPTALVVSRGVTTTGTKQWMTVGDSRVRAAHAAAHGQTKPIDQPFIVGGEKLMYPGDMTLGASIENVANCRCNVRYEV